MMIRKPIPRKMVTAIENGNGNDGTVSEEGLLGLVLVSPNQKMVRKVG